MFRVLELHEEREPTAVLKAQSKRAQKRLLKEAARREEAERRVDLGRRQEHGNGLLQSRGSTAGDSTPEEVAVRMYEEVLASGDAEPDVLADICAALDRLRANCRGGGPEPNGASSVYGHSAQGFSATERSIDFPPGPGPGSVTRTGPLRGAGGHLNPLQGGQVPSSVWLPGRSPSLPTALPNQPGSSHPSAASIAARLPPSSGAAARSLSPPAAAAVGAGAAAGVLSPALSLDEEFPELRRSGTPPSAGVGPAALALAALSPLPQPCSGNRNGGQHGRQHTGGGGGGGQGRRQRGGSATSRNGSHHGVKVIHAAQPKGHNGHTVIGHHHHASSGSGRSRESGGGDDGGRNDGLNLALLWELLDGGLSLRADPLDDAEVGLEGPDPDELAASRRLLRAQFASGREDEPARGVSQEEMIEMMARAHRRQCKRRCAASGAVQRGGGGGGGGGPQPAGNSDSDDEPHLYKGRDESKSWRRTVEWMEKNDWVRVTNTQGKHDKYKRLLPNGQHQAQTVCCSPSDALRGIRNLQADLARKDADANAVIRAWRQEQRQRKRAAAAAAAAEQDF